MQSSLPQENWDKKVIDLGGSILQSWVWGEFQKSQGRQIFRMHAEDYAGLLVKTSLPFGKNYLYCPRGPLGDPAPFLREVKTEFVDDRSLVFARIEPLKKMDLQKAPKETQPSLIWMVDLQASEENILMGMKPKHRYNINLAKRKGVLVREGSKDDLLTFWKLLMETANRQKFRLHPQNYYWQMYETLFPKHLKLLVSEYKGAPLAAMFLSFFGDTATYLHGGTSVQNKEAMAPFLLHFEAMRMARLCGIKYYDLGGISNDEGHSWSGISRFKKGFGGFEVSYPGTYDVVFSPVWYNVYSHAHRFQNVLKNLKN